MATSELVTEGFTPTKWDTAQDKSRFAKQFVRFVKSDFSERLFSQAFYKRLSLSFGHIAHFNRHGFYQTFFSYVLDRNRDAHKFTLRNGHKDMKYLAAMANNAGLANPVGAAVKNYYALAEAAGRGTDYIPMLSDVVAELNGVSLDPGAKKQAAE